MDAGMREWIDRQFLKAPLGDVRRGRRLARLAAEFAGGGADASATITSVLKDIHQSKAAYRLLDNPVATHDNVIAEHCAQVLEEARRPGTYLLIEDTTTLAYPGRDKNSGLGPIGESFTRGLWLHNTLAVRLDAELKSVEVLGLLGQQMWVRPVQRSPRPKGQGRGKESGHARQKREDRESKRWTAAMVSVAAQRMAGATWIYVADRESDIYEVFRACGGAGCSYVIRASYSRALAEKELGYLLAAVGNAPLLGHTRVELRRENREATLQVRGLRVQLKGPTRPGGRLENQWVNVVEVREVEAPAGCQPVVWRLITDLPVQTLEQCLAVVRLYCQRWLIEEMHKALKTGLKVEESQLSDVRRLGALSGMLSVIATRLVQMKLLARRQPEAQVQVGVAGVTEPMVNVLKQQYPPKPGEAITWRWLWRSIAKLGGFPGRRGDGDPGWQTTWRGWQRLDALLQGYALAVDSCGER